MDFDKILRRLRGYGGKIKIMEVCGTHTSSVFKHGLRSMIAGGVRLVSGPGCPVCVTPAEDVDALAGLSFVSTVCCYGDMFRVPGGALSLADAKARGGSVRLIYSAFDALRFAKKEPSVEFVVAGVGFETTAPVYAALIDELINEKISNVSLYAAMKTIPEAIGLICRGEDVDAFICPGHVAAVIGSAAFEELRARYEKPFVIAGFGAEHILLAIYEIIRQKEAGESSVANFYPSVVSRNGQTKALAEINKYFEKTDSYWRGIGEIENSGYRLRDEYAHLSADRVARAARKNLSAGFDAAITREVKRDEGCRCADVLLGRITPDMCELFGSACTPANPAGACMVTSEGACGVYYEN